MRKGLACRIFVYFLCASLFLFMGGLPRMVTEAKAQSRPIGEMVSRGDVKYETGRGDAWKKVENTQFPLFQGVKVKTENGTSIISLANNSQVEVGQNSLLSIEEIDRLHLSHGSILFQIPAIADTTIKIGTLSIVKCRPLQASKNPTIPLRGEEGAIGSVSFHSNGSVTVHNEKGSLSVLNQERSVIAALSAKESLTIPSSVVMGKNTVVALATEEDKKKDEEKKKIVGGPLVGLSPSALILLLGLGGGVGGLATDAATNSSGTNAPICP